MQRTVTTRIGVLALAVAVLVTVALACAATAATAATFGAPDQYRTTLTGEAGQPTGGPETQLALGLGLLGLGVLGVAAGLTVMLSARRRESNAEWLEHVFAQRAW